MRAALFVTISLWSCWRILSVLQTSSSVIGKFHVLFFNDGTKRNYCAISFHPLAFQYFLRIEIHLPYIFLGRPRSPHSSDTCTHLSSQMHKRGAE